MPTDGPSEGYGEDIERKLERVTRPACPACGRDDWVKDPERNPVLIAGVVGGKVNPGVGLDAVPVICGACGFIRLHSLALLRGELD